MNVSHRLPLSAAVLALLAAASSAQDWPHWRGPNYDGSTDAKGLPIDFARDKGVNWKASMPGPAASTPIVFGDRVYLSSIDSPSSALVAVALDRKTGEVVWMEPIGEGYTTASDGSTTSLHKRSNYASPSPVTDGKRVVFFFGNGDLASFSMEGEPEWSRNLQEDYGDFAFQWTFSASPTLFNGLLHLPILQRDEPVGGIGKKGAESFLLGIDPASGETKYRHVRPAPAQKESLESYATPIPHLRPDGKAELLIAGGDVLTGHDPLTGKELWRWGTWNEGHREAWWRLVPSPVTGGDAVLVCAPKRAPVFAVRRGGSGDLGEKGLLWQSSGRPNPVSTDVPTPLFYRDRFYVLSDVREALSCVDPKSGEVAWTLEMPGKTRWRASPTGADGKVWCINHGGDVVVVDAAEGRVLANIPMGEEDDDFIRSSIAVAHDRLYIRTNTHLYSIGGDA